MSWSVLLCGTGETTSGVMEYCTAWGTVSLQEGHPSTGDSYQLAKVIYQCIPFCEERYKDLRLALSLVESKPQLSLNTLKKPS